MRRFLAITLLVVLPTVALALDYTDVAVRYTDGPFSLAESAGISVLTNLGAVSGNPDGTFAPERPVNRAEFLKIALTSRSTIEVLASDARDCFPDVLRGHWFSRYVCLAKVRKMVQGYPDGFFHPERTVNYAEALKMLGGLFGVTAAVPQGSAWYVPYREGAYQAGVGLPAMEGFMDQRLTRGQVARLVAAYAADARGELALYRAAERGQVISSSSSSQSSVSSVSSAASVASSSASSVSSLPAFPARSHFLIAGERSQPIGGATFFANLEPVLVTRAKIVLKADIDGIDAMYIVDSNGVELGQIALDKVFDPDEKTFRGALSGTYRIEKGTQKIIGAEVRMKLRNQGGTSEEIVQMDSLELTTVGEWSTTSYTSGTDAGPYPKHQTSMGTITEVRNAQEAEGILPLGSGSQLAAFTITGKSVTGITLRVENLEFQVGKTTEVTVGDWTLGTPESNDRFNCSFSSEFSTVSCTSIPASMGTFSGGTRTFRLFGDTSLASGASDKTLQISLNLAGNLETNGAIHWTDESGHFRWVELEQPLARRTLWK